MADLIDHGEERSARTEHETPCTARLEFDDHLSATIVANHGDIAPEDRQGTCSRPPRQGQGREKPEWLQHYHADNVQPSASNSPGALIRSDYKAAVVHLEQHPLCARDRWQLMLDTRAEETHPPCPQRSELGK
ncbi:MAG: hypothetical protein ACYDGN_11615 [Acidimicrobiales bacterium]